MLSAASAPSPSCSSASAWMDAASPLLLLSSMSCTADRALFPPSSSSSSSLASSMSPASPSLSGGCSSSSRSPSPVSSPRAAPLPSPPSPTPSPSSPMLHIVVQHPPKKKRKLPHTKLVCQYCLRSFTRQEHHERHLRSHTGERPFACKFPGCDRSFSRFDNMVQHLRSHPVTVTLVHEDQALSDDEGAAPSPPPSSSSSSPFTPAQIPASCPSPSPSPSPSFPARRAAPIPALLSITPAREQGPASPLSPSSPSSPSLPLLSGLLLSERHPQAVAAGPLQPGFLPRSSADALLISSFRPF